MAAATSDNSLQIKTGNLKTFPVEASEIIYQHTCVGDNGSGYAQALAAGDPFLGFAEVQVDNSTGAAGDKYVRVRRDVTVKLAISSLAITDVGKDVYASDDQTYTLTQGSNTRVGYVEEWESTGYGWVRLVANRSDIVELTDNSGGTASDTLADITEANNVGSSDRVPTENAIASLAAKLNEVIRHLGR